MASFAIADTMPSFARPKGDLPANICFCVIMADQAVFLGGVVAIDQFWLRYPALVYFVKIFVKKRSPVPKPVPKFARPERNSPLVVKSNMVVTEFSFL